MTNTTTNIPEWKIAAFDESTGQVTIRMGDLAPIVADLPIDENGNVPTGDELTQYLRGFAPTWHFERLNKLKQGIKNAADIHALVEPFTEPTPTTEQLAESVRQQRDYLLALSDWTQVADAPVDRQAWATYRQALRDVPAQPGFPSEVQWPVAP